MRREEVGVSENPKSLFILSFRLASSCIETNPCCAKKVNNTKAGESFISTFNFIDGGSFEKFNLLTSHALDKNSSLQR